MLEAYNDFSKFDTIEFTNNVYEPLHKIKKQSLSGELFVNIYGGGTIDTERKFITGYNNLSNMRKPTNSYARYFKNEGYDVVAMHPGYGVFYNRNTVNYNLGFDNYWNYENTFNKYTGWRGYASDSELFQMIFDDLKNSNSNNKPYFNFTVTYQNHGPYSDFTFDESYILIKNYAEKTYNVFNTYLSGIQETNTAIYSLYNLLKDYEEPTILILFGDHNPSLGEEKSVYYDLGINVDMSSFEGYKNVYTVPYFIYGNNAAKKVFNKSFVGMLETISPNYLMNELFNYIGFSGNEYLQYTNDVKEKIDVISSAYYKENGEYVNMQNTNYQDLLDELKNVTYYWANDAGIQN